MIDTHAHLYSDQFNADREAMVQRALASGLELMLLPNIDLDSVGPMHQLEDAHPQHMRSMMGLHPGSVESDWQEVLELLRPWFEKRNYVAVGEIGIDLYWRQDNLPEQQQAFLQQVQWALELDLPVVIHSRESCSLLLDLLGDLPVRGVFHCFTGNSEEAKRIIDRGMYVGIGGVLTYKANQPVRDLFSQLPRDRVVLETDAPYLAPIPHRGKRNESAYINHVAATLADVWGISVSEVCSITSQNAKELFRL
ncbi:MAG: hydrolase TatD [Sphingobacteriaceae bacterium]|nr:hydrolase TatD [Sphingobacteriaceae bacterium]